MEIQGVAIRTSNLAVKQSLANDILRLLGVRKEKAEGCTVDEWLIFVTNNYGELTAEEIFFAFEKCMTGEILDQKNEKVKIYQRLDNIITANVLNVYRRYKRLDERRRKAKEDFLKAEEEKNREMTPEKIEKINKEFLDVVYKEVNEKGFSDKAYLLYDELLEAGKLKNISNEVAKRLYRMCDNHYTKKRSHEITETYNSLSDVRLRIKQMKQGKDSIVKNICRSVMVCNYLKKQIKNEKTKRKNKRYSNG